MSTTGERIKKLRLEKGLSQEELGAKVGVKNAAIHKYENGLVVNLKRSTIAKLAEALDTTPAYLLGFIEDEGEDADASGIIYDRFTENEQGLREAKYHTKDGTTGYRIGAVVSTDSLEEYVSQGRDRLIRYPVIGSIAAGYDSLAVEEATTETQIIAKSSLRGHRPEECFVLRVKGDSMYPEFRDGDKVLVQRCSSVDSGTIAVIMYNGDEATLKKVRYTPGEDWLELIPINPEYAPKRIEGPDLEQCHVLGRVMTLLRDY